MSLVWLSRHGTLRGKSQQYQPWSRRASDFPFPQLPPASCSVFSWPLSVCVCLSFLPSSLSPSSSLSVSHTFSFSLYRLPTCLLCLLPLALRRAVRAEAQEQGHRRGAGPSSQRRGLPDARALWCPRACLQLRPLKPPCAVAGVETGLLHSAGCPGLL